MSGFGLLRIFKRLRALEDEQLVVAARFAGLDSFSDLARGWHRNSEDRTAAIEEQVVSIPRRFQPCARCGSVVDLRKRENGPRVMERGDVHIIACNECIPYVKRSGFRGYVAPIVPEPEAESPEVTA